MKLNRNGAIVYQGPSMIDGAPIVAIVTGLTRKSKNEKTGNMAQVFILRADMSPLQAIASGADGSICGDCKHRGTDGVGRSCYVVVAQAPQAVYRSFAAGNYGAAVDPVIVSRQLEGRAIRLGAYGDPAAVPVIVWESLTRYTKTHTGYTHQWRSAPYLRPYLMASVDTPREREQAQGEGWRTFRVRRAGEDLTKVEIACPASAESGYLTTCEDCGLCAGSGKRAKSIAILVHGPGSGNFVSLQALRASASA